MCARVNPELSGDGWSKGPGGVPVWGKFGAAGLFLVAGDEVLLQHRATWTNNGGTWGIPGGARDKPESPEQAALRETEEETGISPADVEVLDAVVTAGPFSEGWTYTTVLARTVSGQRLATTANEESAELRWVPFGQVEELELLKPFREALPGLLGRWEELTS
ncbi:MULTISPECIES: NUDIX domain-containing protein [Corynebacterium]|uniref:NUDIX hydrolase n=2 Tax=Corynebacterium TaxID=1716 RepID=A0A553FV77_9CORY|nr:MULTISPECIES: NUDIX hydrolase [Corynebacterium]OFK64827.1 NTP pyrophosphohydrolase [Corynebacterium sp. HMSC076G08]OFO97584.1 NTP pyrophosphohydrolase [Corynebacterium sp. HMSC034H07]PMC72166.1 NUDIX hydrolase [Corynebacterium aurimucosum]TRX61151.1 NUDIX hydrolase [Corynebacterium aurimucosum]TVU84012.1 NUDIX hydrolase [Corynebacterium aurimucosum]